MSKFLAACIQLCSGRTIVENVAVSSDLIREAAARGAKYIQTPEMTHLVERDKRSLMDKISLQAEDPAVKSFATLAKDLKIILHIGSLAIARPDGKVANRGFLFGPDGTILSAYDKIHMFDVDLDNGESWRESNTYEAGTQAPIVETPVGKVGMGICYDLRFPALFRTQALAGADILTAPACFTQQTGEAHWHVLLRARAIENATYVVAAGQSGTHEDGRETFGHSLIVDPWGRVVSEAPQPGPTIVLGEIDLDERAKALQRIPVLSHVRNFDTPMV